MNISFEKTTVGVITKSDTFCEDWLRILSEKTATKDISKFVTRAVKELIEAYELDRWEPEEKSRVLNEISQSYMNDNCYGAPIVAYETEDGEDAVEIKVWNNYPATLVNCKLGAATHALLLADIGELSSREQKDNKELPKLYLFNRKELPLVEFLLKVLDIRENTISTVSESIDLDDDIVIGGPFGTVTGKVHPIITVFPIKHTFGQ